MLIIHLSIHPSIRLSIPPPYLLPYWLTRNLESVLSPSVSFIYLPDLLINPEKQESWFKVSLMLL